MFKTILSNASNVSTGDAWSEFEKQNLNDGADDNLDFDLEDFLTRHEFSQDFKTDHRNHYFKKVSQIKAYTATKQNLSVLKQKYILQFLMRKGDFLLISERQEALYYINKLLPLALGPILSTTDFLL
jgi:hypothetical protein